MAVLDENDVIFVQNTSGFLMGFGQNHQNGLKYGKNMKIIDFLRWNHCSQTGTPSKTTNESQMSQNHQRVLK